MLNRIVNTLVKNNAFRVTKYVSPKETIRVTRRRYRGNKFASDVELIVTIGRPNYREREFIKSLKKAGEPFPVKKLQIQYLPKAA